MDYIPNAAIAMAIGLFFIIWVFLGHMMISQAPDSHLQFLLDVMKAVEEGSKSLSPPGSSAGLPDDQGMSTTHETARSAGDETKQPYAQHVWREVPLLFTTSLRGRGL